MRERSIINPHPLLTIVLSLLFAIWFVASFFKITTHGIFLSPDSYIYLDTAQNIVEGRGIVHSFVMTSEIHLWGGKDSYIPMSYWAPGFSCAIALIKRINVYSSFFSSGAICVWLSLIATGLIIFLQTNHCYGFYSALWSFILFLGLYPISYVYSWVWSDGFSIPFILGALWLLGERGKYHKITLLIAGVLAGIAFSIRYINGVLLPLGICIVLLSQISFKDKISNKILTNLLSFTIGWAIVPIPVFFHNLKTTGNLLGLSRPGSTLSLWENLKLTISALSSNWFPPQIIPNEIQGTLGVALVLFFILIVIVFKKYSMVKDLLKHRHTFIHCFWGISYLSAIVIYTSMYRIDIISHRLLFPFTISLLIVTSGLMGILLPLPRTIMIGLSGLVLILFTNVYPVATDNFYTTTNIEKDNPRLSWVCLETHPDDWIIGDSTFDIGLVCGHRRSLCFTPTSEIDKPPNEKTFRLFLRKLKRENSRVLFLLRKGVPLEESFLDQWIKYYGELITQLVFYGEFKDIKTKTIYKGKSFIAFEVDYNLQ